MASPRYQFRLDQLRAMARNGFIDLDASKPDDERLDALADRVQLLAQEILRLRRREILRMGGFDR